MFAEISVFSDYSICLVYATIDGGVYQYYIEILTFSINNEISQSVNPSKHYSFYHVARLFLSLQRCNEKCLTCDENSKTQ